jgi:hypothetical protein
LLPSSERDKEKFAADQPLEVHTLFLLLECGINTLPFTQYSITEVWSVPYVGTVVNGILNAGSIKTGDVVLLGPDANGNYQSVAVKSMQRKRLESVNLILETTNQSHSLISGLMSHTRRPANAFP